MDFDLINYLKPVLGRNLSSLYSTFGSYQPNMLGVAFERYIQFNLESELNDSLSVGLEYEVQEIGLHDTYIIRPWKTKSIFKRRANIIYQIPSKFIVESITLLAAKDDEGRLIEEGHLLFISESSDQLFIRPIGAQCELWLWYNYEKLSDFLESQELTPVNLLKR